MEATVLIPTVIEKEIVDSLTFPKEEVLCTPEEIHQRRLFLEKGSILGNNHRVKFKIIFEDDEDIKQVETTIWGTTEKNILLKRGMTIPIHRIHEIRAF